MLGRATASISFWRAGSGASCANTNASNASQVISVVLIQNGATSTVRLPSFALGSEGSSNSSVPPGTAIISIDTGVPVMVSANRSGSACAAAFAATPSSPPGATPTCAHKVAPSCAHKVAPTSAHKKEETMRSRNPLRAATLAVILSIPACLLTGSRAGEYRNALSPSRSLFDGKTLSGWTPRGGRYDGDAAWGVEDGTITGRVNAKNEGGLLYTERKYTSFDFECDTQLDAPFDSGIFVRMAPPPAGKGMQITLDDRDDGEICALYADGFLLHNEAARRLWKPNDWNRLRVRVTGFDMRVETWLNGEAVTDFTLPKNEPGYAPTGLLGVQVHGARKDPAQNAARFKNLSIRELPVIAEEPSVKDGWTDLLAGGPLGQFTVEGKEEGYRLSGGVLTIPCEEPYGELRSKQDYQDFQLRLEFAVGEGANSGVFLRAKREDKDPAYSGCELQILDDANWERLTGDHLKPWQLCSSLYGAVPAGEKELKPTGEWNLLEVLYRGDRLAVALNGRTLYDVRTGDLEEAKPPFAERARTGFIGLQRHGGSKPGAWVKVRNAWVKPE